MTKVEDSETTLETLKTLVRDFCDARAWHHVHTPKDLAIGLVTEASELLEIFRYRSGDEIETMLADECERTRVADELADALFCLLRFADRNGFDLTASLRAKLVTTAEKYPVHQ